MKNKNFDSVIDLFRDQPANKIAGLVFSHVRKFNGVSLKECSEASSLSIAMISYFEKGERRIKDSVKLEAIARSIGMQVTKQIRTFILLSLFGDDESEMISHIVSVVSEVDGVFEGNIFWRTQKDKINQRYPGLIK